MFDELKTIYTRFVRLLRCMLALLRSVKVFGGSAGIAKRKQFLKLLKTGNKLTAQ